MDPLLKWNFEGDGQDHGYVQIAAAVNAVKHHQGITLELGVRRGGGSYTILTELVGSQLKHFAVDPYGEIPYHGSDNSLVMKSGYDDHMYRTTVPKLKAYAKSINVKFGFVKTTDIDFLTRFSFYKIAFAFVDGPHQTDHVNTTAELLGPRINVGGIIIFDNTPSYYHAETEHILFSQGFESAPEFNCATLDKKLAYRKIR